MCRITRLADSGSPLAKSDDLFRRKSLPYHSLFSSSEVGNSRIRSVSLVSFHGSRPHLPNFRTNCIERPSRDVALFWISEINRNSGVARLPIDQSCLRFHRTSLVTFVRSVPSVRPDRAMTFLASQSNSYLAIFRGSFSHPFCRDRRSPFRECRKSLSFHQSAIFL